VTKRFFGTDCSNRQENVLQFGTDDRANCDLPFRCPGQDRNRLGTRGSRTEKETPTQQLKITASYKQNADNRSETINPGIGRVLKLVIYLYYGLLKVEAESNLFYFMTVFWPPTLLPASCPEAWPIV
jgi:hypothetical protein